MTTKIIHFLIGDQKDKAEFTTSESDSAVKDLFRTAALAGPQDILKLYNFEGNLMNISSLLPANQSDRPYKLVVYATSYGNLASELGLQLSEFESRLADLESRVRESSIPSALTHVKQHVEDLRNKLESLEHLSWIGLHKSINGRSSLSKSVTPNDQPPLWKRQIPQNVDQTKEAHLVQQKFSKMSRMALKEEVKTQLRQVDFNNWQWEDTEMLVLLREMYTDLGLLTQFHIPVDTIDSWLMEVYRNYNRVPFHNFKHCFMVSQMMYGLIHQCRLVERLQPLDILVAITSAICHDLDHPGYNNMYQINAQTELAVRYNDNSPLENHHCSVAFKILAKPGCNIFQSLDSQQFKQVRSAMIRSILATDMAKHNEILDEFKEMLPKFDYQNPQHIKMLQMVLIKCADISNECRPMEVAEPWIDCLLLEFFNQSDAEKREGLPVAPFMDRDKVNKNSSQVNFINLVLLPLFDALAELFPQIHEPIISPLHDALKYYRALALKTKDTSKSSHNHVNGEAAATHPMI